MNDGYVHGYGERESTRLRDQAATLTELLQGDTRYPAGSAVLEAGCGVGAQTENQGEHGGDAKIGRRLRPLLVEAGFAGAEVSPRLVYVDGSRPAWAEGFTRNTFTAMVEGIREPVLARGLMRPEEWRAAIDGLLRTTAPDGVFCYTFFKAVAVR